VTHNAMAMESFVTALGFILVAAVAIRYGRIDLPSLSHFLAGPFAPAAVAVLTGTWITWVWGSLRAVAPIHDERSYLLQAEIFASGRWTAPARPLAEFWEQYHVFVTPAFASKYPPGHALLLTPGIWFDVPGLMPVVLSATSAALVFLLARRVANPWIALFTWLLWLSVPTVQRFLASYMSQSTSIFLVLLSWWALLEWREKGRQGWLIVVAICVGWGAITRPLTMLIIAIPIAALVLTHVVRAHLWRSLGAATVVGFAILLIIPLWSDQTLGDWKSTPYAEYSRVYFPYDAPGFGPDSTSPLRQRPHDMEVHAATMSTLRDAHLVDRLPSILAERAVSVGREAWSGWRLVLLPFALLGLVFFDRRAWFALGSTGTLLLGYLVFAHGSGWIVYYFEIFPLLAFASALGLANAKRILHARFTRTEHDSTYNPSFAASWTIALLCVAPGVLTSIADTRVEQANWQAYHSAFERLLASIPTERNIVFVRYAPWHNTHMSLVYNGSDLSSARNWVVYDLGERNLELVAQSGGRTPFIFDEERGELFPMFIAPHQSVSVR
jgi:hypothetical protein